MIILIRPLAAILAIGVALSVAAPAIAQTVAPAPVAVAPAPANERQKLLDGAATLAEHMTEFSIAGDKPKMQETMMSLDAELQKLKSIPNVAGAQSRMLDLRRAVERRDNTRAALSAIEIYRYLQEAMDPAARPAPIEIALFDYSGFKLSALALAARPDWKLIAAANTEAAEFWKRLEPRIKEKALKNLVITIQNGLAEGLKRRDSKLVGFAARALLDTVDLLEGQFK